MSEKISSNCEKLLCADFVVEKGVVVLYAKGPYTRDFTVNGCDLSCIARLILVVFASAFGNLCVWDAASQATTRRPQIHFCRTQHITAAHLHAPSVNQTPAPTFSGRPWVVIDCARENGD